MQESQAELLVKPLNGDSFRFPLDKEVVSIGRSKKNDLVLADQWLSRQHAEIVSDEDQFFIRDLESRNGTMVNGVRIKEQVPLQNTDVINLGDQTLTFIHENAKNVVLSDGAIDLEGTVVVPTEELLKAARSGDQTWDEFTKTGAEPSDSQRIVRQNQNLSALSQASMALISDRPTNELLEFILELAFKTIPAQRGVLMLTTSSGDLEVQALRTSDGSKEVEGISFSRSIADKVVREKVSILTSNAMDDPRFRSQQSIVAVGIRSAMCVPLWNGSVVSGLIYVDSLIHENVFTQDELTLLTSLANVAAIKLENAKLLEEMIEKKRMESELALANDIQQNLLPNEPPRVDGWDLAGSNTPCYTIGGDYFDFLTGGDSLGIALGDVSGKGAGAALMMAVLRASIHSASETVEGVPDILAQTNRVMYRNSPAQFYVTFFLGHLDTGAGRLCYANAGHIPPILYHRATDTVDRLEVGGTVLGLFDLAQFEAGEAQMDPGDILIVFTDGLSEAWGEDEEEFGEDRLGDLLKVHHALPAAELQQRILTEVEEYTAGARATDDRTMIVVKRT